MASRIYELPRNYINKIIEDKLKSEDRFVEKFCNNNTLEDFKEGDYVTCSYYSNTPLLKVLGHLGDKVTVSNIDINSDIINISPEFLELALVDKKIIRVLYED